jgi:hypothetical protein
MKLRFFKRALLLMVLSSSWFGPNVQAQYPAEISVAAPTTWMWAGSYGMIRVGKRTYWDAQFHYRTINTDNLPYVGRLVQIYNRHAINYRVTDNFRVALGGVMRFNFAENRDDPAINFVVPEPRIWHEYIWAVPLGSRIVAYHRIRIEHRWSKGNGVNADWIYRDRWRYKFYMMIPINKSRLEPGAYYFAPDIEIITQTGRDANASFMEDLRFYPQIGYIASPRLKFGAAMMYTLGQERNDPFAISSRWVARLNVYWALDARKFEDKIPRSKFFD